MARIVIDITAEELRSLQSGRPLVGRANDGAEVELRPVPSERFYEIRPGDVGKATIRAFGQTWMTANFMGRILPGDVGKRVYRVPAGDTTAATLRGDGVSHILQVENDAQRDARLAR